LQAARQTRPQRKSFEFAFVSAIRRLGYGLVFDEAKARIVELSTVFKRKSLIIDWP